MFHKVVWQYMQGMLGFLIITLLQIYQGIFDTGNRLRYMIELWPWVCGLTFSAPCCVPTILQWVFCLCRCYRVRGVVMYQQAVAFHFQRTVRRWCAVSGKQLISSMQRDMLLLWTVTVLYSMTITHWPISDRPFLEAIASRNVFVLSLLWIDWPSYLLCVTQHKKAILETSFPAKHLACVMTDTDKIKPCLVALCRTTSETQAYNYNPTHHHVYLHSGSTDLWNVGLLSLA